jgi:MFS family permease
MEDGVALAQRTSLWRHRDFLLFWTGQSASMLGSSVSYLALPLVGVLFLHVNAFGMGLLATVERLPPLLVGPFVGPLVDRLPRRSLMIVADAGRAALLSWIPIGAWLGVLALWHLLVIGFGVGALTMLFTVAYQAFLPNVIQPEQLNDGNGKLTASQSVAEVGGPGVAGWLMAAGGPPTAIIADAASYVISASCLVRMRARDVTNRATRQVRDSMMLVLGDGFRLLWRDPVLRTVTVSTATMAFFAQLQEAVYFLFLVRSLHFSAGLIGVLFSLSAIAGFGAAILCDRLAKRVGLGPLIVTTQLLMAVGCLLLALATGPTAIAAAVILAGEASIAAGLSLSAVGFTTLRQVRTADEVRGRVIGASRFLTQACVPVAALLGGALGGLFGLRVALLVGGVGTLLGAALVLRRDVVRVSTSLADERAPAG